MAATLKRLIRRKEALYLLITIVIVAGFTANNKNFIGIDNLRGVMQAMAITGIMSVAVTCTLIGGGIDLSMTAISLLGGVLCAIFIREGIAWPIAVVLALLCGAALGGVNAFMIAKLGMMPFIASIGLGQVLTGFRQAITNIQNVNVTVESFWWGSKNLFGFIPVPFVISIVLLVGYGVMLSRTQMGRNIYLVGGNPNAARLAGLNPTKIRSLLCVNSGVIGALSGIVLASRMRLAMANSLQDSQMPAITASILGGVAFGGGSGGMVGTFIGIMMLNFFSTGMYSLAPEAYWTTISTGVLLIVALIMDFFLEKSRRRALMRRAVAAGKEGSDK